MQFLCPHPIASIDRGHIVLPSFSVFLSAKICNINHNFWMISDKAFVCQMCGRVFSLEPRSRSNSKITFFKTWPLGVISGSWTHLVWFDEACVHWIGFHFLSTNFLYTFWGSQQWFLPDLYFSSPHLAWIWQYLFAMNYEEIQLCLHRYSAICIHFWKC